VTEGMTQVVACRRVWTPPLSTFNRSSKTKPASHPEPMASVSYKACSLAS